MTDAVHARGLSLIELLVLLAILAVLAASVLLVMPDPAARRIEREAERIGALVELACEQAAVSGRDVGIRVGAERLDFGRFEAGAFVPFADDGNDPLRARPLANGLTARVWRDGVELPLADGPQAQIACLAEGDLTPFTLVLRDGESRRWRVRGTGDGRLEVARDDAS